MPHTPGPWRAEFAVISYCVVYQDECGDDWYIADIFDNPASGSPIANARLIAAAPDLLAFCQDLLGTWRTGGGFTDDHERLLRDAIQRATGEMA